MLERWKSSLLVFTFLLYVLILPPLEVLSKVFQYPREGVFIIIRSPRGILVQPKARGEIIRLAFIWGYQAGLKLTSHGQLLKYVLFGDSKGYILSLSLSLKSFLESKGYKVNVKLRELLGGEITAVMEVRRRNLFLQIYDFIKCFRGSSKTTLEQTLSD